MVKFRREILQVLFGAIGYAVAIQLGLIKQTNPFLDNFLWGIAVMVTSRFGALLLGGK